LNDDSSFAAYFDAELGQHLDWLQAEAEQLEQFLQLWSPGEEETRREMAEWWNKQILELKERCRRFWDEGASRLLAQHEAERDWDAGILESDLELAQVVAREHGEQLQAKDAEIARLVELAARLSFQAGRAERTAEARLQELEQVRAERDRLKAPRRCVCGKLCVESYCECGRELR
jgi:dsDNA-specific endonuclease/ATPase MutS2